MPAPLFQPGQSGNPNGRPKKSKYRADVSGKLKSLNFCPFEEMVNLFRDPDTTRREKITICSELGNYVAAKLRSMEIKNEDLDGLNFIVNLGYAPSNKENTNG
jgi:hypothetical protein